VVPEVLVTGGGGALEGLAATFMRSLTNGGADGTGTGAGAGAVPRRRSPEGTTSDPAADATAAEIGEADATGLPDVPPAH
jgi:hypothetical protein